MGEDEAAGGGRPAQVALVTAWLRQAITSGAIPPGERLSSGRITLEQRVSGSVVISAFAVIRRERLAHHLENCYYAGLPSPSAAARLAAALAGARAAAGLTLDELAAQCTDAGGWRSSPARETMISGWATGITAAENGQWTDRWAWVQLDAVLGREGALLGLHDMLNATATDKVPGARCDTEEARINAVVTRAILADGIPPGAHLTTTMIARPHGVRGDTGRAVLGRLRRHGLTHFDVGGHYAAPGGPPDPAVTVRLGCLLAEAPRSRGANRRRTSRPHRLPRRARRARRL